MKTPHRNFKDPVSGKFEFPMAILRSVDECSKSFILFTINNQDEIEIHSNITSSVAATSLATKCLHLGNIIMSQEGQELLDDFTKKPKQS